MKDTIMWVWKSEVTKWSVESNMVVVVVVVVDNNVNLATQNQYNK